MNVRRIKVGLELTSKCNLRCGMCPLPVLRRPYEDMVWPLVERAAKEIHGNGFRLKWLHEMGEPLLYSRLSDDGKSFTPDKGGKQWTLKNPEDVKGHEGHHVKLAAHVYKDTNELHVMKVTMMNQKAGKKHKASSNPS